MRGARTILVLLLALAAMAAAWLALSGHLSLASLQARRAELEALVGARPLLSALLYTLIFVPVAVVLPGAAVLKVAAGAVFGLWLGMLIAEVATTLAACAGFLAARYLAREATERRYGRFAERINQGLRRDGPLYLLAMRLNPFLPFFLVNAAMGLTRMRLWVYALCSLIGLIPASFVYANAGTQLARIDHPSDILSPGLIFALLLLSLLPIGGSMAARWMRRRREAIEREDGGV